MNEAKLHAGAVGPVRVNFVHVCDLESVPHSTGWYSWFQIPRELKLNSLQLYRHFKVGTRVEGIFNLAFEGRLNAIGGDTPPSIDAASAKKTVDTLKKLFLAFAPPLYIGISTDLQARLKAHRKHLREYMRTTPSADTTAIFNPSVEADSEVESQYFGKRIGEALQALQLSPDELFIKLVYADDPKLLKPIESLLNYSMTPHYGRK